MKSNRWWAILVPLFAFAQVVYGQLYQFPIGENYNNQPAKVEIVLQGWGEVTDQFTYLPQMGPIEIVARKHLSTLSSKYVFIEGKEETLQYFGVVVTPGPLAFGYFDQKKLGNRWVVPSKLIDGLELEYKGDGHWELPGVINVSLRLFRGSQQVKYYSSSDASTGDTPCQVGSAQSYLSMGIVTIDRKYTYPWLKDGSWDSGVLTIESLPKPGLLKGFASFDLIDGHMLEASDPKPAFLAQLVKPVVPARITGVVPKSDGSVEVRVYGDGPVNVEALTADGQWTQVSPAVGGQGLETLSDGTKGVIFHPEPGASSGFFRLRPNTGLKASAPK